MGVPSLVAAIVAFAAFTYAQHGNYEIPQVRAVVSAILEEYKGYVTYSGPSEPVATPALRVAVGPVPDASVCSFWMESIAHQGIAAFNNNSSYAVFRNVRTYGAKGDGITDDTAAIQAAISDGARYSPASGVTATNTPAVVYFPAGTYLITSSIIDYYNTQLIGNPNCIPTLLASPNLSGLGVIDGDQYAPPDYNEGWGSTNVFFRQVHNFIIDMRQIPASSLATGIHWPTAQATSVQNIVFYMSDAPGTKHTGLFIEDGSAGFITDLIFHGGQSAMHVGNQQYTMRNITISNAVTGINFFWSWGFTFFGLNINNVTTALDMTAGGPQAQNVHAVNVVDSTISNAIVAFNTSWSTTSLPKAAGVLNLENVVLTQVPTAVVGANGAILLAGTKNTKSKTIDAYTQGNRYNPSSPKVVQGTVPSNTRASALTIAGGNFYTRSKPQYGNVAVGSITSVRSAGAIGNGVVDDTAALQKALNTSAAAGKLLFFDAGTYKVTDTLYVPPGSKIVGESYSVIMSSGTAFDNIKKPKAVVQVGVPGDVGMVEWSNMIVSTQGGSSGQSGAVLIEWNLLTPSTPPSGMWDVHTRIGGFIGSNFQGDICPTTPSTPITSASQISPKCYAAFMSMHITPSAAGLYLENNWFWTADHDIDANVGGNQVSLFAGRGLLAETQGPLWLYGTSIEHHALYQYQLTSAARVMMGQIQTETPYWQPNPNATLPFPISSFLPSDPVFPTTDFVPADDKSLRIPNANAWGFRAVNSTDILIYGAGLYSFFNNYSTSCSNAPGPEVCQSRIFGVEGKTGDVSLYDLHVVGTHEMITDLGKDVALYSDNYADFTDNIAVFRT